MKNENIIKLLAATGGAVTLIEAIIGIGEKRLDISKIIPIVVAIILAIIVLITIISPEKYISLKWMVYAILGIAMIIYGSLTGGILVLIAGFVGYTER